MRTPEQLECWNLVVATAMNQLILAHSLGQTSSRPWSSTVEARINENGPAAVPGPFSFQQR